MLINITVLSWFMEYFTQFFVEGDKPGEYIGWGRVQFKAISRGYAEGKLQKLLSMVQERFPELLVGLDNHEKYEGKPIKLGTDVYESEDQITPLSEPDLGKIELP